MKRRIQTSSETSGSQNICSMLLNGTIGNDPPLISYLGGIGKTFENIFAKQCTNIFFCLEIARGFHKTTKNDLTIHHIPGDTGPSYGFFTLEPGATKLPCRISWNLVSP